MRIGKVCHLASAVALAVAAAACGGHGGTREAALGNAAPLAASDLNSAPREDLQEGGTFVWAVSEYEEQHNMLHPQGNKGDVAQVMGAVMPSAIRYDDEGRYVPNEAYVLDVRVGEDGLSVEYTLNPDAVWSDGEPITWEDYEAEILTMGGGREGDFELGSTEAYQWVDGVVRGEDEYSFSLEFKEPYAEWPSYFSPLYPKRYMEDEELFSEGYDGQVPVTAGPFGAVEFDDVAQRITVTRDEDWWADPAMLDEIIFDNVALDAQPGAFDNGEIDGFYLGYDAAAYELLKEREGTHFTRAVHNGHRLISLNAGSGTLSDVRVRQAIALAINRDTLARVALGAVDWPITGEVNRLLRSSQHGYQDNSGELGEFDPVRAGELLDEAGWALEEGAEFRTNGDGETLTIVWVASDGMALAQDEGAISRDMLADVGIEVDIRHVPGNALFSDYIIPGNYGMASYVLSGTTPFAGDAASNYGGPYDGAGEDWGNNHSFHSTQEINDLFDELGQETDPDRYAETANRIDAALWEEVLTIPLFERPGLWAMDEDLRNWGEPGLASDYVYEDIGWIAR